MTVCRMSRPNPPLLGSSRKEQAEGKYKGFRGRSGEFSRAGGSRFSYTGLGGRWHNNRREGAGCVPLEEVLQV